MTEQILIHLTALHLIIVFIRRQQRPIQPFFDVVYYTAGENPWSNLYLPLLNIAILFFQTEASAKTAEYSDGKVEWRVGNHKNATFVVDNKEYEYNEQ